MIQEVVFYVIALLLFVRRMAKLQGRRDFVFLTAFLAVGALMAFYENVSLAIMLEGILIFDGIASTYHSKENYGFYVLAIFFIIPFYQFPLLIAQAMLLGFLSNSYFFLKPNYGRAGRLERKRDVVQIIFGIVFILAFATFHAPSVMLTIILLILLASLIGNYGVSNKKNWVSKALYSFERKNAALGQGAMWLAMGTLAAFSFLSTIQIIAVLAAIFVGDAVATLAGTAYKVPIPYNKKKSVIGTIAYFASAALISVPFLGYGGVITSLAGALVESAPKQIDDNFDTAVVLILLIVFLVYTGLA